MTTIKTCTEERYWEMLEVLPPAIMDGKGFMVGEPWSHRQCTVTSRHDQPTFSAFFLFGTKFYEATEAMTIAEYKAITPDAFHRLIRDADKTVVTPSLNGPAP